MLLSNSPENWEKQRIPSRSETPLQCIPKLVLVLVNDETGRIRQAFGPAEAALDESFFRSCGRSGSIRD